MKGKERLKLKVKVFIFHPPAFQRQILWRSIIQGISALFRKKKRNYPWHFLCGCTVRAQLMWKRLTSGCFFPTKCFFSLTHSFFLFTESLCLLWLLCSLVIGCLRSHGRRHANSLTTSRILLLLSLFFSPIFQGEMLRPARIETLHIFIYFFLLLYHFYFFSPRRHTQTHTLSLSLSHSHLLWMNRFARHACCSCDVRGFSRRSGLGPRRTAEPHR